MMKNLTDSEWRGRLSPKQYHVLRERGTDAPFTGKFVNNFETGMYRCAACGQVLFDSATKFESECGWPSFDSSLGGNVEFCEDDSFGMQRVEVTCKNCGSHLGHIFDDGPKKTTGKRFCINSTSLNFTPKK